MSRVELEIDELVLRGLDADQAEAFVAALRRELAAGLVAPDLRADLAARGDIDLPGVVEPVDLTGPLDPGAFAAATAQAVRKELVR